MGFSQGRSDCVEFKTGKFKYISEGLEDIVIRSASFQKELNPVTGTEIIMSIEWISECKYVLTFLEINNHPNFSTADMKGKKIHAEITGTEGDSFFVRARGETLNNTMIQFEKIGEMPENIEDDQFSPSYYSY